MRNREWDGRRHFGLSVINKKTCFYVPHCKSKHSKCILNIQIWKMYVFFIHTFSIDDFLKLEFKHCFLLHILIYIQYFRTHTKKLNKHESSRIFCFCRRRNTWCYRWRSCISTNFKTY